jgi:exosortase E/protease (VPEID-CTERM system)
MNANPTPDLHLPALPKRALVYAGVLVAESLIPGSMPHPWFHPQQIMAAPIVFGAAFLFFGRRALLAANLDAAPIRRAALWLHLASLAGLLTTSALLLLAPLPATVTSLCIALWYASIVAMVATLTASLFPLQALAHILRSLRLAASYAALTTLAAMSTRTLVRWLWNAPDSRMGTMLQTATFSSVKRLLHIFYPQVITVPGTVVLGTPRFHVQIAGECSGIEGLALTLMFTVGWLLFARRELRLTRALLMVPAALTLSWLLNLLRIASLIALGDAGYPDIAVNGFHSEAGWILFNIVTITFLLIVQNVRWLRKDSAPTPSTASSNSAAGRNIAAPYLVPFLAVLATAMLTHAASSGFDWLYPLRLLVAAVALWWFRNDYRHLNWRFGWLGIVAGIAIFGLWLATAHILGSSTGGALAQSLAALPPSQRAAWLTARALAAIITVPITEELAFRGYIARRLVAADVDTVPFSRLSWLAIAISSVAFGLLHGSMWLPGILAGILFALVAKQRNRIGEAIAAHATANLLLAVWVLARGDYGLW